MNFPHYGLVPKGFEANLRFRKEVLTLAGGSAAYRAKLREMCSEDMLFYVNLCAWTYDPRNQISKVPFITYPFQDEAMNAIGDCIIGGRDFAMPKSRDMGASWMGLTVFEWFWHFRENLSFLLISRNEDYVDKSGNPKSLFWKIDFLHENQPRWLLPTGRWLGMKDPNRRLLHLGNADNGSVIDGESTTGDAGRGDRRTAMFIDEHAAFEINDGFRILRATRDTTNCRGFNSTPQGANNGFYEVCHNTSARVIRLHWSEHPEKARGMYETEKHEDGRVSVRYLDDWSGDVDIRRKGEKETRRVRFPEEYPFRLDGKLRSPWYDNECARCVNEMEIAQELDIDFLGSDYQFFDPETIHLLRKRHTMPPAWVGDIEIDIERMEVKRLVSNPRGKFELWIAPDGKGRLSEELSLAIGADISAGTGASNSVASLVNKVTGEKIGVFRDSNMRPNPFAKHVVAMAKWANKAYLCWDASGPTGEVFTKRVIASGYGNVYYRRREKKVGRDITLEPGYYLNPQARTALFEDYRDALGDGKFINRSERGILECLQFIRKPDGTIEHSSALNSQDPSGARTAHGDEVVADALACLCLMESVTAKKAEKPGVPIGSLAWRMERKKELESARKADKLGEGWN